MSLQAKGDAIRAAPPEETHAQPVYNIDGEALWGVSEMESPLSLCVADELITSKVGTPASQCGISRYADAFRNDFRDHIFARESADLPRDEKVVHPMQCGLGHPGICRTRDASCYKSMGNLRGSMQRSILQHFSSVGYLLRLQSFADGNTLEKTAYFMTAYIRKRNPIQVVFLRCAEHDGVVQFMLDDGLLSPVVLTEVVRFMYTPSVLKVDIDNFSFADSELSCNVMNLQVVELSIECPVEKLDAERPAGAMDVESDPLRDLLTAGFQDLPKCPEKHMQRELDVIDVVAESSDDAADLDNEVVESRCVVEKLLQTKVVAKSKIVDTPEAVAAPKASTKRPRGEYLRYDVRDADGVVVGQLLFNQNANQLDAHCSLAHHAHCTRKCAIGRTVLAGNKLAQGRPLGFLVCWLLLGSDHDSRDSHFACRLGRGPHAPAFDHTCRQTARDLIESQPDWLDWLVATGCQERIPNPGEPREPLGLC